MYPVIALHHGLRFRMRLFPQGRGLFKGAAPVVSDHDVLLSPVFRIIDVFDSALSLHCPDIAIEGADIHTEEVGEK